MRDDCNAFPQRHDNAINVKVEFHKGEGKAPIACVPKPLHIKEKTGDCICACPVMRSRTILFIGGYSRTYILAADKKKEVYRMLKKSGIRVSLSIIIEAIEMADDEWNQYLDIEKMNIVSLPQYPFEGELDEDEKKLSEQIEEEWNVRFFSLPSKYDIHEYSIMERFIWSLPEGQMQDSLESAIRGRGAFRRFKDFIIRYGIEQKWYDYQEEAYRKIAVEWCENHGFEYIADKASIRQEEPEDNADDEELAWEEISTEHIIQDEWMDFRRSAYRFPNGSVFEPYYSYSRRDYVVIVASDTDGKYLCVRQYRQGIREVTTEFPAGGIEEKDGKKHNSNRKALAKDALEAAKRELKEETGYESDEWEELLTIPSNATLADNYAHLFAAKNCRRVSGQELDETEFLNVKKLTAAQIEELIAEGKFQQAVHITAWLWALRR